MKNTEKNPHHNQNLSMAKSLYKSLRSAVFYKLPEIGLRKNNVSYICFHVLNREVLSQYPRLLTYSYSFLSQLKTQSLVFLIPRINT